MKMMFTYPSSISLHCLSASRKSTGSSRLPLPLFSGRIQQKAQSHHTWNVTQLEIKAHLLLPLHHAAVDVTTLGTVDTTTQVVTAVIQTRSQVHLQQQQQFLLHTTTTNQHQLLQYQNYQHTNNNQDFDFLTYNSLLTANSELKWRGWGRTYLLNFRALCS